MLCASEPTSSPENGPTFIHVDSGGNFSVHFTQTFPQAKIGNVSFGSSIWALEYLLGHSGMAYLPKYLVDKHLERDELFLVEDADTFTRSRYLVTNKLAQADWTWIAELTA